MITMEKYQLIISHYKQGKKIREIARILNISRNTVRRYIRGGLPMYKKVKLKEKKIDKYKEYIKVMVEEGYTGVRIYKEIKDMGYKGSYRSLAYYIREIREEEEQEAIIRFETLPGKQGQVDWAEVKDGKGKKRYIFSFILGYSRKGYCEFTDSMRIERFLNCLSNGFEYVKGVPEEILFDNMKQVVIKREGGKIIYNETFLRFASWYGFIPKAGIPGKPRTRGKIENFIGYIKRDFYKGRENLSIDELNRQLKIWLEERNNSVCGSHGEIINERAKREKLLPLPERYKIDIVCIRKVDRTGLFSYRGNWYSVPYKYSNKQVMVKEEGEKIKVYYNGEEITVHKKAEGKKERIIDYQHYKRQKVTIRNTHLGAESIKEILKRVIGDIEVEKRPIEYYERIKEEVK